MTSFRIIIVGSFLLLFSLLSPVWAHAETSSVFSRHRNTISSPAVRKAQLKQILSRKEFAQSKESIFTIISKAIGRAFKRFLEWLFGNMGLGSAPKGLSDFIAVAVIVLFLVLLAYVLARLSLKRTAKLATIETSSLYDGPTSPKLALDEAADFATAGNYRSALRLVYLAVLLRLDERDLIRFDRTGTNWEYIAALKEHVSIQDMLRPVTTTFDKKWYGKEVATKDDYEHFIQAYSRVDKLEVAA